MKDVLAKILGPLFPFVTSSAFSDFVGALTKACRKKFIWIAVAMVMVFPACTQLNTASVARLSGDATQLVLTWDGNRAVFKKYKDMLPQGSTDRALIDEIIRVGDKAQKNLSLLLAQAVVSSSNVDLLFLEIDSAVESGIILYETYQDNISPADKFRASMFIKTWEQIGEDVAILSAQSSSADRHETTKEVLSFFLKLAGQVIIPSLQAAGKI